MRLMTLIVFLIALVPARAEELDISGSFAAEARLFASTPQWPGQNDDDPQTSISTQLEIRWHDDRGTQRASLLPYLRWDASDNERSAIDAREAYWAWTGEEFEVLAGVNVVFWGVTESVHLVDVINQTDYAADIDGEDKLGQPMLNLAWQRDWGEISAWVLPFFRERTFPGTSGRLRTPLPVDTARSRFESAHAERHVDLAIRYSHYIGALDFGVSAFSGTSREPRLVPSTDGRYLVPVYDQMRQLGLELQYTTDAWLWKLEAIARDTATDSFVAAVGGFEYTLFQINESPADLGLLLEYQHDGRGDLEPVTIADNDLFLGARFAANDTQDTSALAGIAYDLESGETVLNIEAERRIGNNWSFQLTLRSFAGASRGTAAAALASDDHLQLRLERFF